MRRHLSIQFIMPVLMAFAVSSCVVYHPHNVDVPLLHERGQLQLDASASLSAPLLCAPALNATVSFAPANHLAVQAAASLTNVNCYYAQGAVGTWFAQGPFVVEGYLGFGHGNSLIDSISTTFNRSYRVSGSYNLFFGQVNLGLVNLSDGLFDIGVGLKGGYLAPNFQQIDLQPEHYGETVTSFSDGGFLFQPQLVARIGVRKVKFSFNMGYALISNWAEDNNYFNYDRLSISLGINYRF